MTLERITIYYPNGPTVYDKGGTMTGLAKDGKIESLACSGINDPTNWALIKLDNGENLYIYNIPFSAHYARD